MEEKEENLIEEFAEIPTLGTINKITNIQQLSILFEMVERRESDLLYQLQSVVVDHESLQHQLESVEIIPTKMRPIYTEAENFSKQMEQSSSIAQDLSSTVKGMDFIRKRLKDSIQFFDDIVDTKTCWTGVQKAINERDYEMAASLIHRYSNIDRSLLEDVGGSEMSREKDRLIEIIDERYQESIRRGDPDQALRFCKLSVRIGMFEMGVSNYCGFICRLMRKACKDKEEAVESQLSSNGGSFEPRMSMVCIDLISHTFKCVGEYVKEYQEKIEKHFGVGTTLYLMKHLLKECETNLSPALLTFSKVHNLEEIFREIRKRKSVGFLAPEMSSKELVVGGQQVDISRLTCTLQNLALISQRYELLKRYVTSRVDRIAACIVKAVSESDPNLYVSPDEYSVEPLQKEVCGQLSGSIKKILFESETFQKIQELMQYSLALEDYYIFVSLETAKGLDRCEEDKKTSTIVDYTFFVFQESMRRSMATGSKKFICNVIEIVSHALHDSYLEYMKQILVDQMDEIEEVEEKEFYSESVMKVLNNIELSEGYVVKLTETITDETDRVFKSPKERDEIKICLSVLSKKPFSDTLSQFLETMTTKTDPDIRLLLEGFAKTPYEFTEEQFSANEDDDPFTQQFLGDLSQLLEPFNTSFSQTNFERLVHGLMCNVVKKLEKRVLQKKFNHLGGLQLDRDLRKLISFFSARSSRPVRVEFARLIQMASLLSLETAADVLELMESQPGSMSWRLGISEVRDVMARRGFPAKEIVEYTKAFG